MPKLSYGPEAKKRTQCLFTALLDFANDELEGESEKGLEGLRSHIQLHWPTNQQLVVRTQIRHLVELTRLAASDSPLTISQVKEALKQLEQFLQVLEDNRASRRGSNTWHFTLTLWCSRWDRAANLQRFDQVWEQSRPARSKRATGESAAPQKSSSDRENGEDLRKQEQSSSPPSASTSPDFWTNLCRTALESQRYADLSTNPLTANDGLHFSLEDIYVPLGLVERRRRAGEKPQPPPESDSSDDDLEDAEISQVFQPSQFLERLKQDDHRRVAIVGEPGAGKTTLLQRIATGLLETSDALPIWISLADLADKSLEEYLLQDWLKTALRQVTVPPEKVEALGMQFNQGRVWLLLDAVDEMNLTASTALMRLAKQLTGWLADARAVITCRLTVWDAGKNALANFKTYRSLNFSYGDGQTPDQVGAFIQHWFQNDIALADGLRAELSRPELKRIKDAVRNPLRLALLCRTWTFTQGRLPETKATLYRQFVNAIYTWKQDLFPTTLTQQQQLNTALGQLALRAMTQSTAKFRLPHHFVLQVLEETDISLLQLALQLGWLTPVALSETGGETIYAFYHPSFQEYFAAQAAADWRQFLDTPFANAVSSSPSISSISNPSPNPSDTPINPPIFDPAWREIILLWLGREEIAIAQKESFIEALTNFEDECGGFYRHQAYFLAAEGLAEFSTCSQADAIVNQLVQWRFNRREINEDAVPATLSEKARITLLKTDRACAISALEQFIHSSTNLFDRWLAAYGLGKVYDPRNPTAIAALKADLDAIPTDSFRIQRAASLGKVDPGNPLAIHTLTHILESTDQDAIRRKAAYQLGRIDPDNAAAIAALVHIIDSTSDKVLRRAALNSLQTLNPNHPVLASYTQSKSTPKTKTRRRRPPTQAHLDKITATLHQQFQTTTDDANWIRVAGQLGRYIPGHPQAIAVLVEYLQTGQNKSQLKRAAEQLRAIVLEDQIHDLISQLKPYCSPASPHSSPERSQECFNLLWRWSQQLPYSIFRKAWNQHQ